MNFNIIKDNDLAVVLMDMLLMDDNGRIDPLPRSILEPVPFEHIQLWCHQRARYGVPTKELINSRN